MLAFTLALHHSNFNNHTHTRKNMNNSKLKTKHPTNHRLQQLSAGTLLLFLILLNTSCSSAHHKASSMKDVLAGQSDLLSKLEQERREPALLRKIRRDESLWQAEVHLREAIKALKDSSRVVESAL
jgi:hypothetical protein